MSIKDYNRWKLKVEALTYFRTKFKKSSDTYKELTLMLEDLKPKEHVEREDDGEFPG